MSFLIGYGEDIHLLIKGRKLKLCCIEIPYEYGLLGHSDADAPLHALTDAILGALAKGDIGRLFPDDDPNTEGIDSAEILKKAISIMQKEGYAISNIDLTIFAESPKLSPYIEKMRERIAELTGMDVNRISIKAKTGEGVDAVGEKKAIRSTCVLLLENIKNG